VIGTAREDGDHGSGAGPHPRRFEAAPGIPPHQGGDVAVPIHLDDASRRGHGGLVEDDGAVGQHPAHGPAPHGEDGGAVARRDLARLEGDPEGVDRGPAEGANGARVQGAAHGAEIGTAIDTASGSASHDGYVLP
jgi:hypothetical protein